MLRVKDEVSVKYEIAAGMRKTSDIEGPALLFENVKGYPGWRVLGGLFATRKLVALGLGVPQEQMLERYLTLEDKRIPPEIVSSAPCKEIKWTGEQIDLTKLPIVTHASKDCRSLRHHRRAGRQRSGHRHSQSVRPPDAGARQR